MSNGLVKVEVESAPIELARARIAAARNKVAAQADLLKDDLSKYDFRNSIRNKPWNWILGGLAVGFLVGTLLGGKNER